MRLFALAAALLTALWLIPGAWIMSQSELADAECCLVNGVCQPWNPIFGTCAQACDCSTIPPTPTPAPTPIPLTTGLFEPMPVFNNGTVANYVQGPSAVWLAEGIAVFLDWGKCCLSPDDKNGGEKIGFLFLSWNGNRWYYSDPWIDTRLMLNIDGLGRPAHEAAFPSAILARPYEWWVAYSSTQYPNPDGVIEIGVIKSATPFGPPYEVKHRSMFVDGRRAWSPTLALINQKLYLYTNDYYQPPEGATVRQRVWDSQTIGPGEPVNIPMVTDVAQAGDGTIYALSGQNPEHGITLYSSKDGLNFTKVRTYTRPGEQVFDGGFLRWPDSRLEEPFVVFGNSIPAGEKDLFKRWRLVWWAEPFARLPRALTGFIPRAVKPRVPNATPSPTPPPASSGVLQWIPPDTNYVESPWATRIGDSVWIGGHGGFCCQDYLPDGRRAFDTFWSIVTSNGTARPVARWEMMSDASAHDDHETGGYSPLYIGDRWQILGGRTERSYWGQGNRLRPFHLETTDPILGALVADRIPLFYPREPLCHEMGDVNPVCTNSIGTGQHGGWLTTRDGRVLAMVKDDVNRSGPLASPSLYVIWEIDPSNHTSTFVRNANFGPGVLPSISDWARAQDGRFYAYGGNTQVTDWYNSTKILEWVSINEGATWALTGRSWPAAPGYALWDAGVMRDGNGVIAAPFTLVAITAPYGSWATEGTWKMWWWTAGREALPRAFGQVPDFA